MATQPPEQHRFRGQVGELQAPKRSRPQLKSSGLDWTLAYPVTLSDKPASNNVAVSVLEDTPKLTGMPKITRADVAAWLLKTVTNGSVTRQTVVLREAK